MVFQSYALYPHMTVYGNLSFSLKNFHVPKAEIDRRVREAADDPRAREAAPAQAEAALGRAAAARRARARDRARAGGVPHGRAALEPRRALRVQTRAEILKLQTRLGTTTIYVTHDQVEAMTMGDRIAVMSQGVLQQIGTPKDVYTKPANTFVATFIGSPSMNVLPSDALGAGIGGSGRLVGFRPEDIELANGRAGAGRAGFDATVEVIQYLGDEQLVYLELRDAEIVAKLSVEESLELGAVRSFAVPLGKLHLFDAESGVSLGTAA